MPTLVVSERVWLRDVTSWCPQDVRKTASCLPSSSSATTCVTVSGSPSRHDAVSPAGKSRCGRSPPVASFHHSCSRSPVAERHPGTSAHSRGIVVWVGRLHRESSEGSSHQARCSPSPRTSSRWALLLVTESAVALILVRLPRPVS